ncbi:transglycosylase domain-containing protein [Umezawaea beigongshangensis]|uniref:transglycosylase domain-containing protein n=1 Tax=Umezawaea beigongshangensis TaxID=2780383 RepID=UPI0018F15155|nr:transglycosylase domain-containing protein [Umezawaea beigongshangensis]
MSENSATTANGDGGDDPDGGDRGAGDAVPAVEVEDPAPGRARRVLRGVRRVLPSPKLVASLSLLLVVLAGAAFALALALVEIPEPNDFATREATIFTWADGSRITHVGVNRQPVEFEEIPQVVRDAVLAAEDRSFYSDPGVSVTGLLRALKNNITDDSGGNLQGGSTITQQYVKNYYLTREQTLRRKAEEILVSVKIAESTPKDTVLRDYLNTAFFARGAYGVEAASRAYFAVPVDSLDGDPARAAYLAALIQAPYYYATAPDDPEAATALRERWDYVVDGMVEQGRLTAQQRAGLAFPEPVRHQPDELSGVNGYAVDAATQYLDGLHERDPSVPDAATLTSGGYTVVTTYRPETMRATSEAVASGLAGLDPARPEDRDVHLAAASVDVATGAIVGFHGGPDYLEQSFNDAFQAAGPIGSLARLLLKSGDKGFEEEALPPSTVEALAAMRVHDVRHDGRPPTVEDLATTPMRAAAALAALGSTYREPYHVAEIRKDGRVVWRAPEPDPVAEAEARPGALMSSGTDDGGRWAWSMGLDGTTATAVAMFATEPGSHQNRRLGGMSPMGERRAPTEADGDGLLSDRPTHVLATLLSRR